MTESGVVAVVVRNRELRDLICLNLRFESIETLPVESIEKMPASDIALVIMDITSEREPKSAIERLRENIGKNTPLIILTDNATPPSGEEVEIPLEHDHGRIRFDASSLVEKVREMIETVKEAPSRHPLTGLPAGPAVEKHIVGLLTSGKDFSLIVSDMDNMKAFNQRFGYSTGDNLLNMFVTLMKSVLSEYSHELNYIGHRGEDDFVVITDSEQAVAIAEKIVDGFDSMVGKFFSEDDIERGFFLISNSRGEEVPFPLTTVSLVIINTEGRHFLHSAELYDASEELMSKIKERGIHQSYCAVDKRSAASEPRQFFV